ncbi:hypothetical protein B0H15DRAFT_804147 [Mycena belliarum]|uniref:Restriction of telomere capping protein 4 n=1 Tax=Mycena belliarum TaxID=1033014 RepID=A0AAD6XLV2_9AGAR|nr:hypothetical protein B0H15DRAFT_804147 [Mycena belliae]
MDPLQSTEDPVITPIHSCESCGIGVMEAPRVHAGSNNPSSRGKIVQTCKSCYKSHYHTPAYIHSDALHLLARINARQLHTNIPPESVNAPLRFAPQALIEPPPGLIHCPAAGCSTKDGTPRQAARKCIQHLCKTCCIQSHLDAHTQRTYRDSCKAHGVAGVEGHIDNGTPIADVPHDEPPAAALPFHPTPLAGRGRGALNVRGGPPEPAGQGRGAIAATIRPQTELARPMSMTWQNQRQATLTQKGPDPKVERLRLEKIAQHSCKFTVFYMAGKQPLNLEHSVATYPQMQLSAAPSLLRGIGLTENSWIDLYNFSESTWKTIQTTAVFHVDKTQPTIIRIRPDLLSELALNDCLGLEDILKDQPHPSKRRLGDLVSPPKKLQRTESISVTTEARTIIDLSDSPPPSPSLHPQPSSLMHVIESEPFPVKNWPSAFFAYEHDAAWTKYKGLQEQFGADKTNIPQHFSTLFPGAHYTKTKVTTWRNFWLKAPSDIREQAIRQGRTHAGSWSFFLAAVRTRNEGGTVTFPSIAAPAPVVKVEPAVAPVIPPPAVIASVSVPSTIIIPIAPEEPPAPGGPALAADPIAVEGLGVCPFCDRTNTVRPSLKSEQLLAQLLPKTQPSPTPQNPDHRTATSPIIFSQYCKQHNIDSRLLGIARDSGWPEHIDYVGLHARVLELLPALQSVVEEVDASEFFMYASTGMFQKATGYFGSLGYTVISGAVTANFPRISITSDYAPLSWETLIEQVLVPEAIVALICKDLDIGYEEAIEVLQSSTEFGRNYHSDILDRQRNTFPQSSPLLPPRALSPILAPATWDKRAPTPQLDAASLCNYCDEELPYVSSDLLVAMGHRLATISWRDPLPENTLHRQLPKISLAAEYCARHRFELIHIPAAILGRWPFHPHFFGLFHRILDLGPVLRTLCRNLGHSFFFRAAQEYYGNQVTRLSSLGAQYGSNRSSEHGTGYYGERGYQLLDITLWFMFPPSIDLAPFHPLTYDIILREVLIPEATLQLIQQDLEVAPDEAIEILKQSHTFGLVQNPADDNCEYYIAAMRSISMSHRRAEWSLRTWEASGTDLDFEPWLQGQKELEEAIAIKSEPTDFSVPASDGDTKIYVCAKLTAECVLKEPPLSVTLRDSCHFTAKNIRLLAMLTMPFLN